VEFLILWLASCASGSGKQFVSWIHEVDFVNAIEFLIAGEEMTGCVTLASPNPLPNKQFMRAFEKHGAYALVFQQQSGCWKLGLSSCGTELILKSRRVVPGRLLQSGCSFRFPEWPTAAKQLADHWRGNSRNAETTADFKRREQRSFSGAR
jgi:hypothetical protein